MHKAMALMSPLNLNYGMTTMAQAQPVVRRQRSALLS